MRGINQFYQIKCPDKGCEMFDCPKCVTVCKAPHCVTHCQVILNNFRPQNLSAKLYVKSQNATGNVISQIALNQSVNQYVKILTVFPKQTVAHVKEELEMHQLFHSLKRLKPINNAVDVEVISEQDREQQLRLLKLQELMEE